MTHRTNSSPHNPVGVRLTGYGARATNFRSLAVHLARMDEWHMGNMWASKIRPGTHYGKLSVEFYESVSHAEYIVWSSKTPIAWRTYGFWHMPDIVYSPTTTQHQGRIRTALSVME